MVFDGIWRKVCLIFLLVSKALFTLLSSAGCVLCKLCKPVVAYTDIFNALHILLCVFKMYTSDAVRYKQTLL